jgi:hypothetical protein
MYKRTLSYYDNARFIWSVPGALAQEVLSSNSAHYNYIFPMLGSWIKRVKSSGWLDSCAIVLEMAQAQ